jgi:replicative DNA helicase
MNDVSKELQNSILASIIKDSYLFSKVSNLIDFRFFDDPELQLIYNKTKYHFTKFGAVPSVMTLLDYINDSVDTGLDVGLVKAHVLELWKQAPEPKEFIIEKILSFVRVRNIQSVLADYLPKIKNGDDVSIEALGKKLSESISLDVISSQALTLSNVERLTEERKIAVGDNSNPTIIKSCLPEINRSLMFGGYKCGDLVAYISPPGTGKTMTLVNEGYEAALQGFEVLHIFIGDMNNYDGWIRYASKISKLPQNTIVSMSIDDQAKVVKTYNLLGLFDKITTIAYPAESKTVGEMIGDVLMLQTQLSKHFDMIIVDYPDNLVSESDNMYKSGGTIYNRLSGFGSENKSVILVACQPKPAYYNSEIIPLEGAAESSKKQQNLDIMICLGKAHRDFDCLTGFIAKNRRGEVGSVFRVKTDFSCADLHQISEIEYHQLLNDYQGSHNT